MKKLFSLLMMTLLTVAAWAGEVTFSSFGASNWTTVTADDTYTMTSGGVTITIKKNNATTVTSQGLTDAHLRVYKNAQLVIESSNNITGVEFTALSSYPATRFYVGGTALTGNTWTGSATSVTFDATDGQVRLTAIKVTYEDDPDALQAPTILLNGEAPKAEYSTEELPLTLTIASNNGTESPKLVYSFMSDPEQAQSGIVSSASINLGDSPALNAVVGSNTLHVQEVIGSGETAQASNWATATFTVKEPAVSMTSLADVNALTDNAEFTYGEQTVVMGKYNKNMYIVMPDNTAGALIYANSNWADGYTFGQIINGGWSGKKATYNTKPEVTNPEGFELNGQTAVVTPIEITVDDLTLANFGRYAVMKGMEVAAGGTMTGVGTYDQFKTMTNVTAGTYDVYGVIGWNNNAGQLMPLEYVSVETPEELTVTISPVPTEGQTFNEPVTVTITCNNPNALVSYKIDNGQEQDYTEPFTIYESATVTATATDGDAIAEASQVYNIELPAMDVTFTPAAGTYTTAQNVKVNIENAFGEVTALYALNDGEWSEYTENGIDVTESATVKVAVTDVRNLPQMFTAEYVIEPAEPLPSSGTATIVFDDYGTDSNSNITSSDLLEYITEGAEYVASASDISKVYKGATGLKFSSSSANGTLTLNFAEAFENVTKVEVNAKAWANASTGNVDAAKINGVELTDEFANYTIMEETEELASLTLTATKRAYVKSITITWGEPEPEIVTVTGIVTDSATNEGIEGVTVTITKNTADEPETPAGLKRAQTNYTGTTDATGAYSIDVEAEEGATYDITFAKDGYTTQTIENVDLENVPDVALAASEVTGINDITVAEGAVKYVDAMGRVSNRPFQGVNIVIKADGSVSKMVK